MPDERAAARGWRDALGIIAAATIARLAMAVILPLFPDETYYWEWSRHLAAGYFDHPPAIALLVRAGTAIFGATALGVRVFSVLSGAVASLAIADAARRLAGDAAARTAAIVISIIPLAAAGLVLATPDAPLLASTAFAVWALVRALQSPSRSAESLRWWIVVGVALGLAFSSKYTSILLPVGAVLAIAARRDLRARFAEPGPYVACVVATLVFLPVLWWNAHHEWISFTFQLEHGLGKPRGSALQREGDLLGGQAGLVSPVVFVMMGIAAWRALRRGTEAAFALAVVATFAFAFFVYSATRRHVEPNWPAMAYIPGAVLIGAAAWDARGRAWLRGGLWFAGVLSLVVYVQGVVPVLPVPPRRDPIARAHGFQALAGSAQAAASRTHAPAVWLGADRYQDASEIAFHGTGHPTVFAMNLSGRQNQYDLWPAFPQLAKPGASLVLALDEVPGVHSTAARLQPWFTSLTRGSLVELRRGSGVVTTRRIWILSGWKGGWPPRS